MIFVVHDAARWGRSLSVVRAVDAEGARRIAGAGPGAEVTEIQPDGASAVLWSLEESPDSRRD